MPWCVGSEKLVNKMKIILRCAVAAVILSAASVAHAVTVDPFAALNGGAAGPTNWRILTLGGCTASTGSNTNLATGCNTGTTNFSISKNSQVYDGNVGVSPGAAGGGGNLTLANTGSKIVGNVFVDGTNKYTVPAGTNIFGTISQNSSSTNSLLMNASTAAMNAYNDATNDTTCQGVANCSTYTAINNPTNNITITGGAGLNIIDLSSLTLNSASGNLILSDSFSGATFLIDITGTFSVIGGASITEAGGLPNYNVLFNVEGTGGGSNVCITSGNISCTGGVTSVGVVDGIVLAPFRNVTIDAATVDGQVIAGESSTAGLILSNTAVVDAPEPATWMLLSTGLAGLGFRIRRIGRRSSPGWRSRLLRS
jgi:hypothetical protein